MLKTRPIVGLLLLVAASLPAMGRAEDPHAGDPNDLRPGRLICRLAPGASPARIASRYHVELADTSKDGPFALFLTRQGQGVYNVGEAMHGDRDVVWAESDYQMDIVGHQGGRGTVIPALTISPLGSSDAYRLNSDMLVQINWSPELANTPGRRVRVAVLDTGLSPKQIRLWSKVDASANFMYRGGRPYDLPEGVDTNKDGLKDSATGHGTMVAGLVQTVAPQTRLIIAKVADSDGTATCWHVIKGLAFAVKSGAEVANVSMGTHADTPALNNAVDWCGEKGMLVVAAIGNDGAPTALEPALHPRVVCVGGLLPNDTKAPFSNWSPVCDVSAPATGIAAPWWTGQTVVWSGTSFASPLAAGAVADCLRRTGKLPVDLLHAIMRSSGDGVDHLNKPYQQNLGTKLNIAALDTAVRAGKP
jgi:hypothetical protein